jgi:arabinan endo-1,5-alpha-L-arabinosidase
VNRGLPALLAAAVAGILSCAQVPAPPAPAVVAGPEARAAQPPPGPLSDPPPFAHDPTLVRGEGGWYVFFTGKGIQALRSSDGGRTWTPAPPVIRDFPEWWSDAVPEHVTLDAWAPDARAYRGRVELLYAVSTFGSNASAIGRLSAATPAGPWRDEGLVVRSTPGDDFNAIDPELFLDEGGAPWLAFGSFWSGIQLVPLDPVTLRPAGPRRVLAARPEGIEAPALARHGGSYYLFVSAGRCCRGVASTYRILVGRAGAVTGPYLDRTGKDLREGGGEVLFAGDERWKGPGGQDTLDDDLLVFHAYDAADGGKAKLRLAKLSWDADGWPRL